MSKITQMICAFAVVALSFIFGYAVLSPLLPHAEASESARCGDLWIGDGVLSRMDATNFKEVCYKFYKYSEHGPISCVNY